MAKAERPVEIDRPRQAERAVRLIRGLAETRSGRRRRRRWPTHLLKDGRLDGQFCAKVRAVPTALARLAGTQDEGGAQ